MAQRDMGLGPTVPDQTEKVDTSGARRNEALAIGKPRTVGERPVDVKRGYAVPADGSPDFHHAVLAHRGDQARIRADRTAIHVVAMPFEGLAHAPRRHVPDQ